MDSKTKPAGNKACKGKSGQKSKAAGVSADKADSLALTPAQRMPSSRRYAPFRKHLFSYNAAARHLLRTQEHYPVPSALAICKANAHVMPHTCQSIHDRLRACAAPGCTKP